MSTVINTQIDESIQETARYASIACYPEVLTNIYEEQCNITVWQRELPASFVSLVAKDISQNPIMNSVIQVRANCIEDDVADIAKDRIYGEQLRSYMAEIIDMFCVLFDTEKVGLRLSVLDKAMCPRFHFDRVPCRLVTTFCGKGTEWLPHSAIDVSKLGHNSDGKPDEESGLIHTADDIQTLACGDVALLKGDIWEGNEGAALIHRSPALKTGECRLLMTIDFVA